MNNDMLGDLPATGGRPRFGLDPVAIEPTCADCGAGQEELLTYYPADDEYACVPCSNGQSEPQSLGSLGASRINMPEENLGVCPADEGDVVKIDVRIAGTLIDTPGRPPIRVTSISLSDVQV